MSQFASLCVLAYKRPSQLVDCLDSLIATADFPYQLIVNLDGGDDFNITYLTEQLRLGRISNLVLNGGNNRGVGRSFQNCLGLAEGDFIFKIDTDLTFEPNWLSTAIKVLKSDDRVGAISLFDYNHYDPNDDRFKPENNHLASEGEYRFVKDFVSSIYGFRSEAYYKDSIYLNHIPDDGLHQEFGALAITTKDFVKNSGFGVYKSTYVSGTEEKPYKTPTFDKPLVFLTGLE